MKPTDKMTDSEILERMNQLYTEYTLYWNEYTKRKRRDGERVSNAHEGHLRVWVYRERMEIVTFLGYSVTSIWCLAYVLASWNF